MKKQKAISAIIATIMLLMISVSLIGVFYVFSSTLASQTTSSGSAQVSQTTSSIAGMMRIENVNGHAVYVGNIGTVDLSGISVFIDDSKAIISNMTVDGNPTNIIPSGKSAVVVVNFTNIPIAETMNLKIMSRNAPPMTALIKPRTTLIDNPGFDAGTWGNAGDCCCGGCSCAGGSCTGISGGTGCGTYALPPAGGCSAFGTAFTSGGYSGGNSLNLTGRNYCACNARGMNNFQSEKTYTFSFRYKVVQGRGAWYCIWVSGCNTCNPVTSPDMLQSTSWASYTITFKPEPCTTQLSPYFYAGGDNQISTNLYDDIYLIEGFKLAS